MCFGDTADEAFGFARATGIVRGLLADLDDEARARALLALKETHAPELWLRLVTDVTQLEAADEARALGDTLPPGLKLA